MKDQTKTKLFAFKLAEKSPQKKWTAREGVAIAGCSLKPGGPGPGNRAVRYSDSGYYC